MNEMLLLIWLPYSCVFLCILVTLFIAKTKIIMRCLLEAKFN